MRYTKKVDHLPPHLASVLAQLERGLRELYSDRFRGLLLYGSCPYGLSAE